MVLLSSKFMQRIIGVEDIVSRHSLLVSKPYLADIEGPLAVVYQQSSFLGLYPCILGQAALSHLLLQFVHWRLAGRATCQYSQLHPGILSRHGYGRVSDLP